MNNTFGVALFYTTSSALRAEKVLKQAGLAVKLIPTPRQLSSDCGMALRFEWERLEDVTAALQAARVEVASLHAL